MKRRRKPSFDQLAGGRTEPRIGDEVARADEELPDQRPGDATLEQDSRRRQPRALGNAQIRRQLEQDGARLGSVGELLLLLDGGREGRRQRRQRAGLAVAGLAQVVGEARPLAIALPFES